MMSTYNSAQCAKLAGVPVKTLQRWDREGRLKPAARTPGNRRLYTPEQANQMLKRVLKPNRSRSQPCGFPVRRKNRTCPTRELRSNNFVLPEGSQRSVAERPKFSGMLDRIVRSEQSRLVIAHKDRLARSGVELLAHLCEMHSCQIVVRKTESFRPEQELVQDLMTIVHCFSSRLYGLRNYRKVIQKAMTDDQGPQDPAQSVA
jgi:predicted site-specific integrase-resolvase